MPVDRPTFFTAKWDQLFDKTTYPRVEVTGNYFEDIRKFLYIVFWPWAGSGYDSTLGLTNYNSETWYDAYDFAGGAVHLGLFRKYYSELYVLSSTQTVPPTEYTYHEIRDNPPTDESNTVSHEDAVMNSKWELAASWDYYQHWSPENNRFLVRHNSAYDLAVEAYKFLPKYVLKNILISSNPSSEYNQQELEYMAAYVNRINKALWQRDKTNNFSEWKNDGPEPRDTDVSEADQSQWNPLMGDENNLGSYQDFIRLIVDHLSYLTRTNGTGEDDDTYEIEYNRYPLLGDSKWIDSHLYTVEKIVWADGDDGDERETGTKKYFCIVEHTSSAATEPPETDGTNGGIDWETVWIEGAYQPQYSPETPIFTYFFDDYFNCNSSGFEKILYEMGSYDWYYCTTENGDYPASPKWLVDLLDVPTAGWPTATSCWRRIWKYTFGRPKDGNGDYLPDHYIWPGSETPPMNGEPHQLIVTQSVFDSINVTRQWRYQVEKTEDEILTAYELIPEADRTKCLKRHDSIRYNYGNPSNQSNEYWEIWRNQMKDMWTVLSYLEFLNAEDRYTIKNYKYIIDDIGVPNSYADRYDALTEGETWINTLYAVNPHVHISEISDWFNIGYGLGLWTVINPAYPAETDLYFQWYGGVDGADEEPRKVSLCTTITRTTSPYVHPYVEDDDYFLMRLKYKGIEYDSVEFGAAVDATNFSACEVGWADSSITITAEPIDTGLGETQITKNWYVPLEKPDAAESQFHYTAVLLSPWPDDEDIFSDWVPGGVSQSVRHDRQIQINADSTGFHNYIICRIDWSKYGESPQNVFDNPPPYFD